MGYRTPEEKAIERTRRLKEMAEVAVANEPVIEDYDEWGVGALMGRGTLSSLPSEIIPNYLDPLDYNRHGLIHWKMCARADRALDLMAESRKRALEKYGINNGGFTCPFIYKIDDQYHRLKEKSTNVVKRFFDFNNEKRGQSICSKIFGETRADANYRASRRVLVEREELK